MGTWGLIIPINIDMVEPQNEFAEDRVPTVPYYSEVQVPLKHDFNDTYEREIQW